MSVEHQLPPLKADAIAALLTKEIKPVFFLGAGASFKSGIPLAGMLVDAIARFAYCKANNRNPDDPTLMRSDWIRWLEQQSWFRTDMPPADLYPSAVEYLLRPNLVRETQELDKALVSLLQPLLRDHPLVVIGYRGTERSIMKHLLIDQAELCGRFREGIYWCHLPGSAPRLDSPYVAELAATIGSNLQFVEIDQGPTD